MQPTSQSSDSFLCHSKTLLTFLPYIHTTSYYLVCFPLLFSFKYCSSPLEHLCFGLRWQTGYTETHYCISLSFPSPATVNLMSRMLTVELLAHKIPFSLLKMHSYCAWISFCSQPCYYNSLLCFFSLFLEEKDTVFAWDTCFSFLWFSLLYPTTASSSVNSLFSLKLSDLQKRLLNILSRMLNRPCLFCWLFYYCFFYY